MVERLRRFLAATERAAGPPEEKGGWYSPEGDCLFFFQEQAEHYAERVDDLLTVYRADRDDRIVGIQIKGLKTLPKHDLLHVMITQRRRFAVVTLLLATYERQRETRRIVEPSVRDRYLDAIGAFDPSVPAESLPCS